MISSISQKELPQHQIFGVLFLDKVQFILWQNKSVSFHSRDQADTYIAAYGFKMYWHHSTSQPEHISTHIDPSLLWPIINVFDI